tara:strand:+ start:1374 stop:1625 length:252 start_codon:yes stop_codon:yes gene_type:complete
MPQRFLEVQPSVGFDDLVASVNVSGASAGAAGLVALAAELLADPPPPPDAALWLVGAAVALRVVHGMAVVVATRRFLARSKLE